MWIIAGSAAACASVSLLGSWVERRKTLRHKGSLPTDGFFRRDDGLFVNCAGVPVDAAEQARLSFVCSELRLEAA